VRVKYGVFFVLLWLSSFTFAKGYQSNLISVDVQGEGQDVILIHGFASSPQVWSNVLPALNGKRIHTVTIHGLAGAKSPTNTPAAFLPAISNEILTYIAQEQLNKPVLIGHSMGGLISLLAASKNSEAIGQMILIDSLPFYSELLDPKATKDSMAPMAFMTQMGLLNMNNHMFTQQATSTIALLNDKPENRARLLEWSQRSNRQVYAQMIFELLQFDARPYLGNIAVPSTVIYSHKSTMPWSLDQITAIYKRQYQSLQGVSFKPVENSLHFIMWDQPAKLNALIRSAL
jgi:pimeloyl-ACP methyl ester carboxylesterase